WAMFVVSTTTGALFACISPPPGRATPGTDGAVAQAPRTGTLLGPSRNATPAVLAKARVKTAPKVGPIAWASTALAPTPAELKADGTASAETVEADQTQNRSGKGAFRQLIPPSAAGGDTGATCRASGDFCGTAVAFLPSPKLAGEEAAEAGKLLFVLHVSGNFEDPGFT